MIDQSAYNVISIPVVRSNLFGDKVTIGNGNFWLFRARQVAQGNGLTWRVEASSGKVRVIFNFVALVFEIWYSD